MERDTHSRGITGIVHNSIQKWTFMRKTSKLTMILLAITMTGCSVYNQARYPLAWAAKEGNLPEVERLASANPASVNVQEDRYGTTPLHQAAASGQYDIAKYLLDHGAQPNARDFEQATPLYYVGGHPRKNSPQLAELLLQRGADVDAETKDRMTPLHVAALHDDAQDEIAMVLLQHGAKMDLRMVDGSTPLFLAALAAKEKVALLLITKGANVNISDNTGNSPLHAAAARNLDQVVKALIAKGATVNAKNNKGDTPMDIAFLTVLKGKGNAEILGVLKRSGGLSQYVR